MDATTGKPQTHTTHTYIQHDDGTHEIIFHESSMAAIQAAIRIADEVLTHAAAGQRIQLLVQESGAGPQPIRHIAGGMRQLVQTHPAAKFDNLRLALVYRGSPMLTLFMTLFRSLRVGAQIRGFPNMDYEAARAWLRDEPNDSAQPST